MDGRFRALLGRGRVRAPLLALMVIGLWLGACAAPPARESGTGAAAVAPAGRTDAAAGASATGASSAAPALAPAGSASAPASAELPPEKDTINVAVAALGSTSLPLQVAIDSGYFRQRGITVNLSVLAASV